MKGCERPVLVSDPLDDFWRTVIASVASTFLAKYFYNEILTSLPAKQAFTQSFDHKMSKVQVLLTGDQEDKTEHLVSFIPLYSRAQTCSSLRVFLGIIAVAENFGLVIALKMFFRVLTLTEKVRSGLLYRGSFDH
ncbi:TPA: hypothetical protein H2C15_004633 [Salmonella enterica]|nr:hypothetical protein [Salmonella enterica]